MIGPCLAMHYFGRGRKSWLLYVNCPLARAVDCLWCSVSLPHDVVGWAAVCY